MSARSSLRKRIDTIFQSTYYRYFTEYKRQRSNIVKIRKRLKIAGVPIIPVTREQREQIEKRFGAWRYDIKWFNYYNSAFKALHPDKNYDVTKVIPGSVFYPYVDGCLAHPIEARTLSDKNLSDLLLYDIPRPKNVFRFQEGLFLDNEYNIISKEEAYQRAEAEGRVIIKPSALSGAGKGIRFWEKGIDGTSVFDDYFIAGKNYVIQEVFEQHPKMASLYAGSVNTVRIQSLLWRDEVRILSSTVRMGANGSKVDNLSGGGGLFCGVDLESGMLSSKAYDYYHLDVTYDKHPQGCKFEGFIIPGWQSCVSLVKKAAPRFCRVSKLIAWDLAVDKNGDAVLIESNMMESGCEMPQLGNGPLFGDLTDEVLEYVRNNRRVKY